MASKKIKVDIDRLIRLHCQTVDQLCKHPKAALDYKAVFIAAATGREPLEVRYELG